VDEVLPWYEANTAVEKQLARAIATYTVAEARLQKLARTKWGKEAETQIAHLCLSDTHEDDDAAIVTIQGDHAILQFKFPGITPLFLVQSGGAWKMDMAAYVKGLGDQLQPGIKYSYQSADIYVKIADAIAAGKYSKAQEAADALKKATDALNASQ
jgi:hypothetical protein